MNLIYSLKLPLKQKSDLETRYSFICLNRPHIILSIAIKMEFVKCSIISHIIQILYALHSQT